MASGLGKRFGGNKLLADFCGKPMLSYILDCTAKFPQLHRLVVTRHEEVVALCREKGVAVLCHEQPHRNDTIRLGLERLLTSPKNTKEPLPLHDKQIPAAFCPTENLPLSGCIFCPSDQPLLQAESINALLQVFSQNPDKICRLSYGDKAASPVIFGRKYFPELLSLPQGVGGSYLAKKYPAQVMLVPVRDPFELYDVDTPEDLKNLAVQPKAELLRNLPI